MATFDYFKAIWRNGPGVVSDAPDWVLDEIERELPVWMGAQAGDFVGVHVCAHSNLVLGILVSPSASRGDGSLEGARYGSFIHVFATDAPDRAILGVDEVRELFESTYGAPISDGAIRQQRNFMLLDFPYHQDLAKDLFIDKDRVESGLVPEAPEASSAFEEAREDRVPSYATHEEFESRPLQSGSLNSLLSHHDPVVPARGKAGLPFDQADSYAEVIAGLRDRLYGKPSSVTRERTAGHPPALERMAPRPSASFDGLRSREEPSEAGEPTTASRADPPTLNSLLSQSAPVISSPVADTLPLDQPAPVMRRPVVVEASGADVGVANGERAELERPSFDTTPVLARVESPTPRRAWPRIYAAAGLFVVGLLVGGVVVLRLWERAEVDESLAERAAPMAVIPDDSVRLPARERVEPDRGTEAERSSEIAALAIDAPELQPTVLPPAAEVASLEGGGEEVRPVLSSTQPVAPVVIDEAEAELPVVAVVKLKTAPEATVRGAASKLEPTPVIAQFEVVTEPRPEIEERTSKAGAVPDPDLDVEVAGTLSGSSGEILEESAGVRPGESPVTSSTEAAADASSIASKREAKPGDGRRKRERKRVLGQINRYR